jgi:hypothetical protein
MWKAQQSTPDLKLSGSARPAVPLKGNSYAILITPTCGQRLVDDSQLVNLVTSKGVTGTSLFSLDRNGRALVYFVYP